MRFSPCAVVPPYIDMLWNNLNHVRFHAFWILSVVAATWILAMVVPIVTHPEILVIWTASALRALPTYLQFASQRMWTQLLREADATIMALARTAVATARGHFAPPALHMPNPESPHMAANISDSQPTQTHDDVGGFAGLALMTALYWMGGVGGASTGAPTGAG